MEVGINDRISSPENEAITPDIPRVECSQCGGGYPVDSFPVVCLECGGLYFLRSPLPYHPIDHPAPYRPGIARYQQSFPGTSDIAWISLGEGNTPLSAIEFQGERVFFKNEGLNPSGSYKDRGAAVIMSIMADRGVQGVVEDSSGNAGAALAAYAARAGVQARIYVPAAASGPKREQIAAYGANLIQVDGPRSAAADAVWQAYENGEVYASHVYLPHGLAGYATIAFEIFEQLGGAPGTVILPVGHGLLFNGVYLGFEALHAAGRIESIPRLIGVQAAACAPIWTEYINGNPPENLAEEGLTIAEGIRIAQPAHRLTVLDIIERTNGTMVAVHEEDILRGRNELASRGFFIEPTSAVIWNALQQVHTEAERPLVAVLSGSGYKSRE